MRRFGFRFTALLVLLTLAPACGKKQVPVPAPTAPPAVVQPPGVAPPGSTPQRVEETPIAAPTLSEDPIRDRSLDDLNRDSPLKPVFFVLDSDALDGDAQAVVRSNAEVMKRYSTWAITIEGHCDERGTAEYNLALGERRAVAVKTYLVSLGISADRLRTVSYGKEFPFDPDHTDAAWSKNRRAHFVITSK